MAAGAPTTDGRDPTVRRHVRAFYEQSLVMCRSAVRRSVTEREVAEQTLDVPARHGDRLAPPVDTHRAEEGQAGTARFTE
jgi:hypothetical protein